MLVYQHTRQHDTLELVLVSFNALFFSVLPIAHSINKSSLSKNPFCMLVYQHTRQHDTLELVLVSFDALYFSSLTIAHSINSPIVYQHGISFTIIHGASLP